MTESTENQKAPATPKPFTIEIPKRQHDLVAQLLNQRAEIDKQLVTAINTSIAGSKKTPSEGSSFHGTATAKKFGKQKFYLVFAG